MNIIYFSRDSYFGFRTTRPYNIAVHLAQSPRVGDVLYVGSPVSLKQAIKILLSGYFGREPRQRDLYRKLSYGLFFPAEVSAKLRFVVPVLPVDVAAYISSRFWRVVNDAVLQLWASMIRRRYLHGEYVSVYNAFQVYVQTYLRLFSHQRVFADIFDLPLSRPHNIFSWSHFLHMKRNYRLLIDKAKVTFVNTEAIAKKYSKYGSRFHLVTNGVSFPPEVVESAHVQQLLNSMRRPVVGFVGRVTKSMFRYDILELLCQEFHTISFVIAGPCADVDECRNLAEKFPNLKFVGFLPAHEVGYFIGRCDVLMTFYDQSFTAGNVSLKIFQYLSLGKPVVTYPVAPVLHRTDLIYAACSPTEHIEGLKQALAENSEVLRQKRIDFAKENSWSQRIDGMLNVICKEEGAS